MAPLRLRERDTFGTFTAFAGVSRRGYEVLPGDAVFGLLGWTRDGMIELGFLLSLGFEKEEMEMIRDYKKRMVGVLFGGCSPEYPVSLESAHSVLEHMDRERYCPLMIGITREGKWLLYEGDIRKIAEDTWQDGCCTPACLSSDKGSGKLLLFRQKREGQTYVEERHVDVLLPILHGANGEDGTVQALAALAGIPLAGCGVLASALCMDKGLAHTLVKEAGIAVPKGIVLHSWEDWETALAGGAPEIGFPMFVKPVKAGSSFGITKVSCEDELRPAVENAMRYDDEVIMEEEIEGFEVGCAVMGSRELTVGEVDEIELSQGFFDYTEKYTLKTSSIHVPARIPRETAERVKETAEHIYRILGCEGFARVDMFLTPSGELVFNEVNTIPGFTAHSRFPSMMRAAGISFEEVISTVIETAVRG